MWIQIRSMDGKKSLRVDGLSKLTKIEDLREKLVDEFEAEPEEQRLFYRGKQVYDLSENNLMRRKYIRNIRTNKNMDFNYYVVDSII